MHATTARQLVTKLPVGLISLPTNSCRQSTPNDNILSVGCGTGDLECHLKNLNIIGEIEGIDISQTAIEKEREAASAANILYRVADIETLTLPSSSDQAVLFNSSFHHLEKMEQVCEQIRRALIPEGYLILNEYVGANRFNFPDRQRQTMRAAFDLIPAKYRRSRDRADFGILRETLMLPDSAQVAAVDPSEAVCSQDILSVIHQYFDAIVENACGGSLLQFVLNIIAGNFTSDVPNARQILHMLFDIEDGLMESGDLANDFVLIVAQPKA